MNGIHKIRELYELNTKAKEEFSFKYTYDLDHFLRELEQDPPQDFSMATLDAYKHDLDLAIVLAHLPAEVIHAELGDDALMWTWVKYPYSEQKDIVAEEIQRVTGRDPGRMKKAKLAAWQLLNIEKAGLVRAIYDFNEAILTGIAGSVDLPKLLQRNAREGVQLSNGRLGDYFLDSLTTDTYYSYGFEVSWREKRGQRRDKRYEIWLDSPVGLALVYKGEPNAIVGLVPNDVNSLMICQLQGVRPTKIGTDGLPIGRSSSRGLMPIDWKKLLVEVIEDISQKLGYSQIVIQSGHNNSWTRQYDKTGEVHLKLEEALKKYDKVAKRLGFRQAKDKNWYTSLS